MRAELVVALTRAGKLPHKRFQSPGSNEVFGICARARVCEQDQEQYEEASLHGQLTHKSRDDRSHQPDVADYGTIRIDLTHQAPATSLNEIDHMTKAMIASSVRQADGLANIGFSRLAP